MASILHKTLNHTVDIGVPRRRKVPYRPTQIGASLSPPPVPEKVTPRRMRKTGMCSMNHWESFYIWSPRKPSIRPLTPAGPSPEYVPLSRKLLVQQSEPPRTPPRAKRQVSVTPPAAERPTGRRAVSPINSVPKERHRAAVPQTSQMTSVLEDLCERRGPKLAEKPNNVLQRDLSSCTVNTRMASIYKMRDYMSRIFG